MGSILVQITINEGKSIMACFFYFVIIVFFLLYSSFFDVYSQISSVGFFFINKKTYNMFLKYQFKYCKIIKIDILWTK